MLLLWAALLATTVGLRPEVERLQPLAAALADAHRHAIVLSHHAAEAPVPQLALENDEEQETSVALADADRALRRLLDDWPSAIDRKTATGVAVALSEARTALSDYAAARAEARRADMREAAEALRAALGRAGSLVDALDDAS